jgi:hypothetical protein
MMQRTVRFSAITAMTSLLSVAILISTTHFDVARAQKGRAACGKELQRHCTGVSVFGNNALECLKKDQDKLSKKCAALANNVVRRCDRDAAQLCQGISLGQGNALGCLTTARRSVSSQCNAALDAAFLR